MSLFVAQAAKNAGAQEGYVRGKNQGYAQAERDLKPFVDRALGVERIFSKGGLSKLWLNKVFTATRVEKKTKESLPVRRETFLYMLAYAEYHQRHVDDPVEHLKRVSNAAEKAAKEYKENGYDRSFDKTMDDLSAMAEDAAKEAKTIEIGQQDKNMMRWVEWRVDNLKKIVKYASKKVIIPLKSSLGDTVTTIAVGDEIRNDKFDIASDAKKFLGEKMSLKELGF